MPLTEVNHLLIDTCESRFRHNRFDVFQTAIRTVHLAAVTDHSRHRSVDDHVVRRVEVGDALVGIDHGQFRTAVQTSVQIATDFFLLGGGQLFNLVVQIDHAVVDVDTEFVKCGLVLGESVLVKDLHTMAKNDRVRDLHHGRFDVQGEHHTVFVCVFDFLLVELA